MEVKTVVAQAHQNENSMIAKTKDKALLRKGRLVMVHGEDSK